MPDPLWLLLAASGGACVGFLMRGGANASQRADDETDFAAALMRQHDASRGLTSPSPTMRGADDRPADPALR